MKFLVLLLLVIAFTCAFRARSKIQAKVSTLPDCNSGDPTTDGFCDNACHVGGIPWCDYADAICNAYCNYDPVDPSACDLYWSCLRL